MIQPPQATLPVNDWSAASLFNVSSPGRDSGLATVTPIPGMERSAGPGLFTAQGKAWHPSNPMFWVGAFLLATAGLIAGATEIRIGPAKVGASIGKS